MNTRTVWAKLAAEAASAGGFATRYADLARSIKVSDVGATVAAASAGAFATRYADLAKSMIVADSGAGVSASFGSSLAKLAAGAASASGFTSEAALTPRVDTWEQRASGIWVKRDTEAIVADLVAVIFLLTLIGLYLSEANRIDESVLRSNLISLVGEAFGFATMTAGVHGFVERSVKKITGNGYEATSSKRPPRET